METRDKILTKNMDCRGQFMPQPICDLKKALEAGASRIKITSDSRVIFENLRRFALHTGLKLEATSAAGGLYYLEVAQPF